jgi:beta-galactosidase GanA
VAQRRLSFFDGGSLDSDLKSSTRGLAATAADGQPSFQRSSQLGDELKLLGPVLQGTSVRAECCILYSHDNEWALQQPNQPNKLFNLREHIQLFYAALHDRNIAVDFARPAEDLSRYKLVFAPSLHLLAGGEADRLKLYVQNGGTLVRPSTPGWWMNTTWRPIPATHMT